MRGDTCGARKYESGVDLRFSDAESEVQSGGDLVLVGESAEDGLPADPVVREVDRRWRLGLGLGRSQLAECAVRPGFVSVCQIAGQGPAQVLFVNDQRPVEQFAS